MRRAISLGLMVVFSATVLTVRAGEPQRLAPPVDQKQMQFIQQVPGTTTNMPASSTPLVNQDNKVIGALALEPTKTMAKRMLETKEGRGKFYTAKLTVWQTTPQAKSQQPKIEMISRPQIMTLENEKCSIQIGQNVLSKLSTPKQKGSTEVFTQGYEIGITICSLKDDGKVSVRTKLVKTEVTMNEPTNVELTTKTKEAVTEAKLKEPVKFQLGSAKATEPQTWCEMIVDEVVQ